MISTKEVFQRFFEYTQMSGWILNSLDRPEIYEYEDLLGKTIFEMNVDELYGLLLSFRRPKNGKPLSFGSYELIARKYRLLWNWYSNNVTPISNPWSSQEMMGENLKIRLQKKGFNNDDFEKLIDSIHTYYDDAEQYADFIELSLRLLYDGVETFQEIMEIKEDMIDFESNKIFFYNSKNRKVVNISERTSYLLQNLHKLQEVQTHKGFLSLIPCNGGYVKIPVKQYNVESVINLTPKEFGDKLFRTIWYRVRLVDPKFSLGSVYMLGLKNYLVQNLGERTVVDIVKGKKDNAPLVLCAKQYGCKKRTKSIINELVDMLDLS